MSLKIFNILLILCFLFGYQGAAQNRNYYTNIKKSKKESINYSKKLLAELKSANEDKIDKLLITKEQIFKQKEILAIVSKELQLLNEEIVSQENKISSLNEETKKLKEEYARLLQFSYVNLDRQKKMIFILSANSFNAAYKRMIYLKQLGDFRKSRLDKINETIVASNQAIKTLQLKKEEKTALQKERSSSIDSLDQIRRALNSLIVDTRSEMDRINQKISNENVKKELTTQNIKKEISIQIENKPSGESKKSSKLDENINNKFEGQKKRFIWPLAKFVILHHFGDYSHPVLENIVIKNDGVELGTKPGSSVHAIFDGVVANIIAIPGDGNSIIIRHGEYYSVYSKIPNVIIKQGDVVQKGQVIAKLTGSGSMVKLAFQLWKGKEKLNPELWLKRQ